MTVGGTAPMSTPLRVPPLGGVRVTPFVGASAHLPPSGAHAANTITPPTSMADMASQKAGFTSPPTGPLAMSKAHTAHHPAMVSSYPCGMQPTGHGIQNNAEKSELLKDIAAHNAPKDFVRCSVTTLPNSIGTKQKISVPLGLILHPLAPVSNPNLVPEVKGTPGGTSLIIKCQECQAYMNPFVRWEDNGRRWVCNLCGKSQQTQDWYYSHLDSSGKRADRHGRPELFSGTVDYIAPEEYMERPPQPPVFVFVIDVSYSSVATGLLHTVVDSIKEAISQQLMLGGKRLQVGIITYDTSLHFYNLNSSLVNPQMFVISDLEDVFLPLPDGVLVNASDCESSIMSLLDSLPVMFQDTTICENCMGSAVKGAFLAMKHIGGKLLVFASCIPSVGECSLKSTRNEVRLLGTEREVELLRPSSDAYKELANELSRVHISVELFIGLGGNAYIDLASMAPLAKYTGGDVRYYQGFHIQTHGMKLKSDLLHVITRYTGWEAVMRVRVSKGWNIAKFYGHLFIRGRDLIVIPNCHADQTFAISIDLEENAIAERLMCVQSALAYTNSSGERRIRVHTWAAASTHEHLEVLRAVDLQATIALLTHMTLHRASKFNFSEARYRLNSLCQRFVQDLSRLNWHPVCNAPTTSLDRHDCQGEALRYLPLCIMGMLKSVAFRGTNEISADVRTSAWARLETLSASKLAAYFCPRLIALHNLSQRCGCPDTDGITSMPCSLALTKDTLMSDGVYLLDNGDALLIWIGRTADPSFLQAVFGNGNIDDLQTDMAEAFLGAASDVVSSRIGNILKQVRDERQVPYIQLTFAKSGGDGFRELQFLSFLIEDRTLSSQTTYKEFLQRMGYRLP